MVLMIGLKVLPRLKKITDISKKGMADEKVVIRFPGVIDWSIYRI